MLYGIFRLPCSQFYPQHILHHTVNTLSELFHACQTLPFFIPFHLIFQYFRILFCTDLFLQNPELLLIFRAFRQINTSFVHRNMIQEIRITKTKDTSLKCLFFTERTVFDFQICNTHGLFILRRHTFIPKRLHDTHIRNPAIPIPQQYNNIWLTAVNSINTDTQYLIITLFFTHLICVHTPAEIQFLNIFSILSHQTPESRKYFFMKKISFRLHIFKCTGNKYRSHSLSS